VQFPVLRQRDRVERLVHRRRVRRQDPDPVECRAECRAQVQVDQRPGPRSRERCSVSLRRRWAVRQCPEPAQGPQLLPVDSVRRLPLSLCLPRMRLLPRMHLPQV
jgi:hypothetical protein